MGYARAPSCAGGTQGLLASQAPGGISRGFPGYLWLLCCMHVPQELNELEEHTPDLPGE